MGKTASKKKKRNRQLIIISELNVLSIGVQLDAAGPVSLNCFVMFRWRSTYEAKVVPSRIFTTTKKNHE